MTKKSYMTPALNVIELETTSEILNTSSFNSNGGANSSILPGNDPYDGEFRSNTSVWDDLWTK